jgi:hypothetical protein
MKKLIGLFAILFTLLVCVIYRHLTSTQANAKPEAAYRPDPLRDGPFFIVLPSQ